MTLLEVIKFLHGLTTSGNKRHRHLSHTLRRVVFNLSRFYSDVCIKGCKGGYSYIIIHTDDIIVVLAYPAYIYIEEDIYY